MTLWTDNAAAFASDPDTYIDQERHVAAREAVALIVEGRRGKALYVLVRSVERQARIAGAGSVDILAASEGSR